jgi:uncharacterized membrane protein
MAGRGVWVAVALALSLMMPYAAAHGGEDDGDDSLRDMLGGFDVMVMNSFLHSIGAMLLLAGLVLLVARLGRPDDVIEAELGENSGGLLGGRTANRLVWIGLAFNLAGGAMRLYEPGHPSIFDLSGNRWVSIMIAKHLLVLATTVCGVLATLESQPLARRRHLARLALGFVLIIGLLGAAANVVGPV